MTAPLVTGRPTAELDAMLHLIERSPRPDDGDIVEQIRRELARRTVHKGEETTPCTEP
jgi:hypothetical protein